MFAISDFTSSCSGPLQESTSQDSFQHCMRQYKNRDVKLFLIVNVLLNIGEGNIGGGGLKPPRNSASYFKFSIKN